MECKAFALQFDDEGWNCVYLILHLNSLKKLSQDFRVQIFGLEFDWLG
jgi:hypothetical protein